ncbi:MAG TPA: L-serine ammonia-lyase, iron-sulfur-dependent, subunit alpha [Symbiobacteriaceae bacterium]|nr:L-serine ammonia-lyase, iron-sulfur-dependent, subunit alpha [Symbiobacteriaceae bacterium]
MPKFSIFNDVLGPIMVGPSSSHTAGTCRVGLMARALLGEEPFRARISFDPGGSLAHTYRGQGSDRGYVGGLLGLDPGDPAVARSLSIAVDRGLIVEFAVEPLEDASHPNMTRLDLTGVTGRRAEVWGASTGGGMMRITRVNGLPVDLPGDEHDLLATVDGKLRHIRLKAPWTGEEVPGATRVVYAPPVVPVAARHGHIPLFTDTGEMTSWAVRTHRSFGEAALAYELHRSGWSESRAQAHMSRIWQVMRDAVTRGLSEDLTLIGGIVTPSAQRMQRAGDSFLGGPVSQSVVYSTAVMEVSNAAGVVVAAPTAGAAGVLPGVLVGAAERLGASEEQVLKALWAAGGIGLMIARRATFAAEVAGCQAEVGAASAMAAAALVELAGGTPRQAEGAASVALQNSLGMICDPVAGLVQVPCFGKNAMGVGNAYASADMVLGGYHALIPFDEVAEAMLKVGHAMPRELRCTALGGLAATPTAQKLGRN